MLAEAAALGGLDAARVVARVRSELPPGRGPRQLGRARDRHVARHRRRGRAVPRPADELAWGRRLEATFHGTPSGIDPAAAALGRCFRFVRGDPPSVAPLRLAVPLPLVIAFGDRPRSTGAAVGGLRERRDADPARHEALFDAVAAVVERGAAALEAGDLGALGRAFDDNQRLLEELGVSSSEVAALVATARDAGALGAKLTGGGAGGAVIALAERPDDVAARLRRSGATTLVVRVG